MKVSDWNVVLLVCGILVLLIPFTGEVIKPSENVRGNKFTKLFRRTTWRWWIILVFAFIGAWAAYEKDERAESDQHNKDIQAQSDEKIRQLNSEIQLSNQEQRHEKQIADRDKLNAENDRKRQDEYHAKVLENSRKNLIAFTRTLADYDLQYMAKQDRVISILRDSIKTQVPIPASPTISVTKVTSFYPNGRDTLYIHFDFIVGPVSIDSLTVVTHVAYVLNGIPGLFIEGGNGANAVFYNEKYTTNFNPMERFIPILLDHNMPRPEKYWILFSGSYSAYGKREPINEIRIISPSIPGKSVPLPWQQKVIRAFFNANKITN